MPISVWRRQTSAARFPGITIDALLRKGSFRDLGRYRVAPHQILDAEPFALKILSSGK